MFDTDESEGEPRQVNQPPSTSTSSSGTNAATYKFKMYYSIPLSLLPTEPGGPGGNGDGGPRKQKIFSPGVRENVWTDR